MENGQVYVWMNLLGFNRDDEDRGVSRFLEQTGFTPDGVCALLCHPDFFNLHRGMEEEYVLPPDNCAYWGIPRNAERERQPWTNYDIRKLSSGLAAKGVKLYAGVFGTTQNCAFHDEWVEHHPEIKRHDTAGAEGASGHFALKRFADGSYYEDFFIDKVCKTLTDYGMSGVHLADAFCPPRGGMLHNLDFSTDFVTQFLDYTGLSLPAELTARLGEDTASAESERSEWIYANLREEWIRFNAWRWEGFFKKLCDRVHAIGKEVTTLAMYCTDPFETLYCIGIDLSAIVRAGVDRITANILPTSVYITGADDRPNFFHKYMAIAPTTAAHLPKGHLVSMLGLQDPTEEWSAMHHAPCMHERDMYTMMAYHTVDAEGIRRALDGFFLCLGDGIPRSDWDWERERLKIALSATATRVLSPALLWSERSMSALLSDYIHTRRWTPAKLFYELAIAGVHPGATVTPEGLKHHTGTLIVPNFDLLPDDEKQAVAAFEGAVLCTAKGGFDPATWGVSPSFVMDDPHSEHPQRAFCFGAEISCELRAKLSELLAVDDGTPDIQGDLANCPEFDNTLVDTLVFAKVSRGFVSAMAALLGEICDTGFDIDKPHMVFEMPDGAYRIYLFNDSNEKYHRAFVRSHRDIRDVKTISKFPILPPRYMDKGSDLLHHTYGESYGVKSGFEMKIQPAGVTVVDVYCAEK